MVYSGKVLDQWARAIITDAFVVVDRQTFISLWWNPDRNYSPYKPEYEMTYSDEKKVEVFKEVVDEVYAQYGKTWYKTKLISMFRNALSKESSQSKRAIYNQVLIYLFTIGDL